MCGGILYVEVFGELFRPPVYAWFFFSIELFRDKDYHEIEKMWDNCSANGNMGQSVWYGILPIEICILV